MRNVASRVRPSRGACLCAARHAGIARRQSASPSGCCARSLVSEPGRWNQSVLFVVPIFPDALTEPRLRKVRVVDDDDLRKAVLCSAVVQKPVDAANGFEVLILRDHTLTGAPIARKPHLTRLIDEKHRGHGRFLLTKESVQANCDGKMVRKPVCGAADFAEWHPTLPPNFHLDDQLLEVQTDGVVLELDVELLDDFRDDVREPLLKHLSLTLDCRLRDLRRQLLDPSLSLCSVRIYDRLNPRHCADVFRDPALQETLSDRLFGE